MILVWLIVILLVAGVLAGLAGRVSTLWPRIISLVAVTIDFVIGLALWRENSAQITLSTQNEWFKEIDWSWVPQYGIHFHLAMDGLSVLMVVLTFLLGIMSVLASWKEIQEGVGFFHFNLMWILAGIVGVFLAMDLFLFYFMWELMLVPMYFLIAIWGHERRIYAAVKFFLFTQVSGLFMLVAILTLYFIHHSVTGVYSYEYKDLLGTSLTPHTAMLLMLGFFVAFAVKLPMFPFHTWLPDAHTEAPTAGSVILAGLLLKTGAYGMLRFVMPLFPGAAHQFAPIAMLLGVIGIIYGSVLAFAQTDLKRLVAYTSVSHLGFALVGIFAWNPIALQGVLIVMIAHGISTGALFMLVGGLQERTHTREMDRLRGLWATVPVMSGVVMFFSMASVGLPGLGDFIGEFLTLLGTYRISLSVTVAAVIGILISTLYALKVIQRAFHGPNTHEWSLPDLGKRELVMMVPMMLILLWIGLYPQPLFRTFEPAMRKLQQYAAPQPVMTMAPDARQLSYDQNGLPGMNRR